MWADEKIAERSEDGFDASFGRIWPQIVLAFGESFPQLSLCLFCAKHTTSMTQPKTIPLAFV
jgi:hypothetical protein